MSEQKRIGKYEIAEQIGVGGFGTVFKAWDPFIQRWVAVKTCSASDREATQRFFREAQLAGALQHPNITLIFDFGVEGESPYFVQEFLSGTDLDELLTNHSLSLQAVLAILVQVCSGLEFAHSKGIIHRDIKPANIRVLEDGTVKIMDFGIAKNLQAESRLTQTGVALGTAGYLAPEQLAGKPLDQRTDLFSLGILAYELITGARPFVGPNLSNVIYQILHQDPLPPRKKNPQCPERLQRAILKALAKKPEERFDSVRDFAQELKQVLLDLTGQPTERRDTTTEVVREELVRLGRPTPAPSAAIPAPFEARPFERLSGETAAIGAPQPGRAQRRRWLPIALGAAVLLAVGGWLATGGGGLGGLLAKPTPTPTTIPPTPTPRPTPTAAPVPTAVLALDVELFVYPVSEIEIDGQSFGKTQTRTVRLAPGTHKVRQTIEGYKDVVHTVEITQAGQSVRLRLPPFGMLTVLADFGVKTRGARVSYGGRDLGGFRDRPFKVEAGTFPLVVEWPDGGRFEESITVPADGSVTRTVRPSAAPTP
ncbi:MAG: serine/threonine protein kinase [Thermoanaerobaculaceae bacterium]|nr:serine/threonine protein kinase [Thermoanaerobaculaceae bacterium]MDI9623048.1 serine/threonine-protein kinase [Acidobacteriota bacterium]NLH10473.1 protein kinase [Holophagae bacterium]HPW56780.1 serine/threonine-protein kinase [Thermoanaerobaculaceae bacterium]